MYDRAELYLSHDIYDHKATDKFFLHALKKNIAYHRRHCKEYDTILHNQGFHNGSVKRMEDMAGIPVLTTLY